MVQQARRRSRAGSYFVTIRRRHRSGNDQHALHDLRPRGQGGRLASERAPADLSQARLGRARFVGDLGVHPGSDAGSHGKGRRSRSRPGRHRDHEPAGDDARLGQKDRQAPPQRHRLAGHQNQPHLSPAPAQRGDALFGNVDTWLIWQLTGGAKSGTHVTDVTNASRTMLLDLQSLDWDAAILETLGIPRQMLPAIRPSSDPPLYGKTLPGGPVGGVVPVCGDLGDQQAALYGQTCYQVGEAKNTYGTGCFMLLNTGTQIVPSQSGLLTTVA